MAATTQIRVGTRQSKLALVQTDSVVETLNVTHPEIKFEVVPMSTKGDQVLDRALFKIGDKSLFTKELENALTDKKVDLVVHSLKDLPSSLPQGLVIGAILQREDARDAVVLKKGVAQTWNEVSATPGAVIGTSSVRRAAQLKASHSHLQFKDVRGNLNTRLAKLDAEDGPYAALVLAAAGLHRMGWISRLSVALEADECLHAVGQGALAVECREDDKYTLDLLEPLNHEDTLLAAIAERTLMHALEGGCSAPVAAHAEVDCDKISIEAGVWSLDGSEHLREAMSMNFSHNVDNCSTTYMSTHVPKSVDATKARVSNEVALRLAKNLLDKGATKILHEARQQVEQGRNEAN